MSCRQKRQHDFFDSFNADAYFSLILRTPQTDEISATTFCRRFGGGGREIAVGCDGLPPEELPQIIEELIGSFPASSPQDKS